jgi:hypothetical protein
MIRSSVLAGMLVLPCLAGCNTQPVSTSLSVSQLAGSAYCSHADTSSKAIWIDNNAEWIAISKTLNKHRLGAPAPAYEEIDFINYGVLAIFIGQKPTAGYSVALDNSEISLNNKIAELRLIITEPSRDHFTAQVITSPCILVKMPKAGYSVVRIVDKHNDFHHELKLP